MYRWLSFPGGRDLDCVFCCIITTWNSVGNAVGHYSNCTHYFFSRKGIAMFLRLAYNPLTSLSSRVPRPGMIGICHYTLLATAMMYTNMRDGCKHSAMDAHDKPVTLPQEAAQYLLSHPFSTLTL